MRIRDSFVCVLIFLAISPRVTQASETLVDDIVQHWQRSKALALAIANAIPENLYSQGAATQETTLDGQLNGIALSDVLACTMALHTRAPERFQSAFDKPMDSSKAGVIENLTEAFGYCIEGLKMMTDSDVSQMAVFKGRQRTRFDIFWEAYARSTFMIGQASMLMQSKGLTPPEVGARYDF
ncbi:MAG: hypothetical protein JO061_04335 [Acidobacteriaceae bacterium]|nr:hypothetical protein [Acidobacteriaceae bacterium]